MAASHAMMISILFLVFLIVPLVIGIVLIFASRRGRLNYPACGKCQYNLSGSVGTTDRCPECGALFTQAGILPPDRTRRPALMWVGVAFIAVPLTCVGFWVLLATIASARMQSSAVQARQAAVANQLAAQQAAQTPPQPAPADEEPAPVAPVDESE